MRDKKRSEKGSYYYLDVFRVSTNSLQTCLGDIFKTMFFLLFTVLQYEFDVRIEFPALISLFLTVTCLQWPIVHCVNLFRAKSCFKGVFLLEKCAENFLGVRSGINLIMHLYPVAFWVIVPSIYVLVALNSGFNMQGLKYTAVWMHVNESI